MKSSNTENHIHLRTVHVGPGYLSGLQDEVMDDDLLFVGEAQSVLTDECDSEGDAVHGLLPTRPINKFILSLQRNNIATLIYSLFVFILVKLSLCFLLVCRLNFSVSLYENYSYIRQIKQQIKTIIVLLTRPWLSGNMTII